MTLRRSAAAAAVVLALALPTWAGHESPFDPSYYPHEIRIEFMTAAAAAGPLGRAAIHGLVGGNPYAGRPTPPDVAPVESLDAYVVLTVNLARFKDRDARCAAVRRVTGLLAAKHGFVFAPYPVTPYHPDYLAHADLATGARQAASSSSSGSATGNLAVTANDPTAAALLGSAVPARAG